MISEATRRATIDEGRSFVRAARAPRLRTMRQFAEQEIVIPDGPYKGLKYRCDRQPYSGLFFDAVDTGIWNRIFAAGSVQSGKSLTGYVIPALYHLFEMKETVICGLPSMDMAGDKWRMDIRPAIEASRYRDLLPAAGNGSRGGNFESIQFRHGPTLKFMSGGGGDKKRAGFTSRVVVITEVDGMDEAGGKSREADKITQIEARTKAFGERKRIYGECTVSIEKGRIWTEYTNGTASRIFTKCPHCAEFVHPSRESLQGWQGCTDEHDARESSFVFCPSCGEAWTEAQRLEANRNAVLVHRGQEIVDGRVVGELPRTSTLGFRWDAINNLFVSSGEVGVEEWKAQRADDEENAEKALQQFTWTIPHKPDAIDRTPLESAAVMARAWIGMKRAICPPGVEVITAAVDVGKWLLHWFVLGCKKDGTIIHVVDYGRHDVPSAHMSEQKAILTALREIRDGVFREGWQLGEARRGAIVHFVDTGYETDVIYDFCRESGGRYMPSDGIGESQDNPREYFRPRAKSPTVTEIGEGFHITWSPVRKWHTAVVNADHWKSRVHDALSISRDPEVALDSAGSMTLFDPGAEGPNTHLALSKHLTAEKQTEEFIAGKGIITKWIRLRRDNHWFDTAYNALAAANYCGVKLTKPAKAEQQKTEKPREPRAASPIDPLLKSRPNGWIKR